MKDRKKFNVVTNVNGASILEETELTRTMAQIHGGFISITQMCRQLHLQGIDVMSFLWVTSNRLRLDITIIVLDVPFEGTIEVRNVEVI